MDEVEQSCKLLCEAAQAEVLWSYEVGGEAPFRIERYLCNEGSRQLPAMPCPIVGVQLRGKKVLAMESSKPAAHEAISIPSVTLIIPGNYQSYWQVSGMLDFLMIYFRGEAQTRYRELVADIKYPLPLEDTVTGVVAKQLAELLVAQEDSEIRQEHINALGNTLFHQVVYMLESPKNHRNLDTVAGLYPYIYEVVSHIRENLQEKLPIEKLAARSGLKQSHFRKVFKQVTGMSPHAYINKQRLIKVHELLANTPIPIVNLADDFGFSSQSHLTSVFKAYYGITPAQFRRQKNQ